MFFFFMKHAVLCGQILSRTRLPSIPSHLRQKLSTRHSTNACRRMASPAQRRVNEEWDALAGEWDDLAGRHSAALLPVLWRETGLDPRGSRTVLDFGCGTGLLTGAMRRASPSSSLFVCVDSSPSMVHVLQDKMRAEEWTDNVRAYNVALAAYEGGTAGSCCDDARLAIDGLRGTVDLVVASSVMGYVPPGDLPATMRALGGLLKPGGTFFHSDRPNKPDDDENDAVGFTEQRAEEMYRMGGLVKSSSLLTSIRVGDEERELYVGVAVKE